MTDDEEVDQTVFCARVHPRLVSFLRLYTSDWHLAEDLSQEALARACASWAKVSALDSPEAWVHRVAINLAHSWFRRRAAARRAVRRAVGSVAEDPGADPAEMVDLRRALAGLSPRQRQAVLLRHLGDLSVADTAAAMGCAEGTVRALSAQGIERLRVLTRDQEALPDGR